MAKRAEKRAELPAVAYVPTAQEQVTLDKLARRRAALPARVAMAAKGEGDGVKIEATHADQIVGEDLVMSAYGGTTWEFTRQMIAQVAAISRGEGPAGVDAGTFAANQAMVHAIGPQDELEGMLAVQIAAVHNATMIFASRLSTCTQVPTSEAYERSLNRLARTFTTQMEALKRYRSGGVQKVVVQHVQVNEGGQAIVAGEMHGGGGKAESEG